MKEINSGAQKGSLRPVISPCPICGRATHITEVACDACDIRISGRFQVSAYEGLNFEQKAFLETFLRCRGVLRDVELALGISYPTVRGRLDTLLAALGFDQPQAFPIVPPNTPTPTVPSVPQKGSIDAGARRKEILAAISTGAMDADTGLRALQELSAKE